MTQFTFREMFLQGWPLLSILILASILSVTVIWDRISALHRAKKDAIRFVTDVIHLLTTKDAGAALAYCQRFSQPVAVVARAILQQTGGRAARERAGRNALQGCIHDLERYVPILGTIGSIAPFLGLLGTVIGIIKAFLDMATHAGGGIEVVASGIAEALITTAVGLFVAIPAVIGYNYCVQRIRRLTDEIDLAMYRLIEYLCPEDPTRL